jgi:hypothetical protein
MWTMRPFRASCQHLAADHVRAQAGAVEVDRWHALLTLSSRGGLLHRRRCGCGVPGLGTRPACGRPDPRPAAHHRLQQLEDPQARRPRPPNSTSKAKVMHSSQPRPQRQRKQPVDSLISRGSPTRRNVQLCGSRNAGRSGTRHLEPCPLRLRVLGYFSAKTQGVLMFSCFSGRERPPGRI